MFWKRESLPKFIGTFEVGRLCRWMRVLGFDTVYFTKGEKRDLILHSLREDRVILTRERGISIYSGIRVIRLKDDLVENQLKQVMKQMRLKCEKDNIFSRCVLCNSPIEKIKKEALKNQVPAYVYKTQEDFFKCAECGKIYWKGTHCKLANNFLKERAGL